MVLQKVLLIFSFFFFTAGIAQGQNAEALYSTHCSGCHGANLEGTTSASSLIKTEWQYGGGQQGISESISNGIPSTTMTAWKNVLDEDEINALVDFILAAQDSSLKDTSEIIPEQITSQKYDLRVDPLVTQNITTPWGIEFVNSDTALISERPGSLKWLVNGTIDSTPITGLPPTHAESSTGGYMDIALDPDYEKNRWVYLAYSHTNGDIKNPDALALTKIVRGKIKNHRWVEQQTLFEVPDSLMVIGGNRWGCRLLFDDKDRLYFSIGDMAQADDSQDLSKATGKVFRINKDGSIPEDNPFANRNNALPSIFTIGNRNVQGIDIHPVTGEVWATEHGPQGGDEVNILKKGNNYGWPVITYGINYDGSIITEQTAKEGMEQPIFMWNPSIAVCPIEFVTSSRFPRWKNNLLVGALKFQEMRRLTIVENRVIHEEIVFKGLGRVRDLKFGPKGALYVLTNSPDRILKVTPTQPEE